MKRQVSTGTQTHAGPLAWATDSIHANYPDFRGILPIWRRQKYKSRYPDRDCQNTPKSRFSKNLTRFTTIFPNFHPKFKIPRCLSMLTNQKAGLWPPLLFTCIMCIACVDISGCVNWCNYLYATCVGVFANLIRSMFW